MSHDGCDSQSLIDEFNKGELRSYSPKINEILVDFSIEIQYKANPDQYNKAIDKAVERLRELNGK